MISTTQPNPYNPNPPIQLDIAPNIDQLTDREKDLSESRNNVKMNVDGIREKETL